MCRRCLRSARSGSDRAACDAHAAKSASIGLWRAPALQAIRESSPIHSAGPPAAVQGVERPTERPPQMMRCHGSGTGGCAVIEPAGEIAPLADAKPSGCAGIDRPAVPHRPHDGKMRKTATRRLPKTLGKWPGHGGLRHRPATRWHDACASTSTPLQTLRERGQATQAQVARVSNVMLLTANIEFRQRCQDAL